VIGNPIKTSRLLAEVVFPSDFTRKLAVNVVGQFLSTGLGLAV
jgi:hypothetical protein